MNPFDDIFHNTTDKLTAKEIIAARLREARLAKEALEPGPAMKPRSRPRGASDLQSGERARVGS